VIAIWEANAIRLGKASRVRKVENSKKGLAVQIGASEPQW
jgi:hypothetical protein